VTTLAPKPSAYANIRIAGGDTAQPRAMAKRLSVIGRHLHPGASRFLDCGCGAGEYVLALVQQFGLDAHGIEFDHGKVLQAHQHESLQARVTQGDLQRIGQPSASWDYAMLNEVLEHVPDDRRALQEVHRILKPEGTLFIFSPNRWFPFETHGVRWKGSGRKLPHWVPFVPYMPLRLGQRFFDYWARNYWPFELRRLVRETGFTVLERTYVWLTFENISGSQPLLVRTLRPLLRATSNTLERLPLLRCFGVSQVLVCLRL
jgi:SAM-dependent methyltransferase